MRGTMKETSLSELAFFPFAKFFFVVHSMSPLKKKRGILLSRSPHTERARGRKQKKSFSNFYECNKFFSDFFSLSVYCCWSWTSLSHADVVTSQWKKLHNLYLKLASISLNFHKLNFKRDFLAGKKHHRSHFGDEEREGKKSCWKAAGREVKKVLCS